MSGGIFLIQSDDSLVEMGETEYDSESLLQELLAKYPDLLAGKQMDSANPRRWMLIKREMGVPHEDVPYDRWSLDHLFVDQDAIPTLIEVKRSANTEIRRQIVGQMLDYAANAIVYWGIADVKAAFATTCEEEGTLPEDRLAEFLGDEADENEFWQRVETNLKARKMRLVFVADAIPPDLQRIVEFLNEQMSPAEVLAVEIKQFTGRNSRVMVPRVIGLTAEAETKKAQKKWDEESFMSELERRCGPHASAVTERILRWSEEKFGRLSWGTGATTGSVIPVCDRKSHQFFPLILWTYGRVMIQFQHMQKRAPFDRGDLRAELLERLNQIPGVRLPPEAVSGMPTIELSALGDERALRAFFATVEWAIEAFVDYVDSEAK